MKCTNKKWKSKKILICRFEEKRQNAFIGWEICFKMEIYQLASCYWRFSRTDVKFK